MNSIDYTKVHNEAVELFHYIKNFLYTSAPTEQIMYEIENAMQKVAHKQLLKDNDDSRVRDDILDKVKKYPYEYPTKTFAH